MPGPERHTIQVSPDGDGWSVQAHHWHGSDLYASGPVRPFTTYTEALAAAEVSVQRRLGMGRACLLVLPDDTGETP
jgi:hypothetical protein